MKLTYIFEYVWIDGNNHLRSKIRTYPFETEILDIFPTYESVECIIPSFSLLEWDFDGSSTNQAETGNSEIILKPIQHYPNIILKEKWGKRDVNNYRFHYLLCSTTNKLTNENSYEKAKEIMNHLKIRESEVWFGLEQEYFIVHPQTHLPLGFEIGREPDKPQGDYYCGIGSIQRIGRKISERHYLLCLESGLSISGINAEVACSQWEFQIGPVEGIEAANQLWMARYLLLKVAEEEGYDITFEPKPITWGDWNGSGCHTNFSTKEMREENGFYKIIEKMKRLEEKHGEHLEVYGTGNELRLTGKHETSSIDKFTWGISSRNTSVRIGSRTYKEKKGYFEDRRPSSNMNPYLVCSILCKTIILEDE